MAAVERLLIAAVRHAAALRRPGNGIDEDGSLLRTDEELREAALAYDRSLTELKRKRLIGGA